MKKFAKIINEQKQCEIGIGTDTEFYKSIGMEEMEVEQAYDGQWYVKGYAPAKPLPTEEEIQAQLEQGIEAWMNTVVAERHYDSIDTCIARYTDSPNPKYAQEAKAVKDWNTLVWDKCWDILAEVKTGTRPIPALEEVIAELPKLVW